VAFSPDGTLLATASRVGTPRIWDLATGANPETRATLQGHAIWVTGVAFSPDGTLLATASHDGTARIWGSATGEARATFAGFPGGGWAALFADGYKGNLMGDNLWWAVRLCRFAPGELDPYVPGLRRLAEDESLSLLSGG
jgi:hypothetical protein